MRPRTKESNSDTLCVIVGEQCKSEGKVGVALPFQPWALTARGRYLLAAPVSQFLLLLMSSRDSHFHELIVSYCSLTESFIGFIVLNGQSSHGFAMPRDFGVVCVQASINRRCRLRCLLHAPSRTSRHTQRSASCRTRP